MTRKELNPFNSQQPNSAISTVQQGRAMQEVQAAVIMAKQFPRDQRMAVSNILDACTRKTLAEQALYSYPRGGQQITGPSIRLAEAIAQQWGNLDYGIIELEQSKGMSVCQAYSWDLQTNTRKVITFHVEHSRYTKANGKKPLTDPRDIYEMVSNQGSRRVRNCILAIIPGDVVESAVKQINITQADNSPATTETIAALVKAFAEMGVSEELLNKRLGHNVAGIKSPQLIVLRNIYQSIKDHIGKASDFFEIEAKPNRPNQNIAEPKPLPTPENTSGDTINNGETNSNIESDKPSAESIKPKQQAEKIIAEPMTYNQLYKLLSESTTQSAIDNALDYSSHLSDDQKAALVKLAITQSKKIAKKS